MHIEDKSHLAPSAPLWPPAMAREAGRPWLDWLLGKIGMTNEEAGAMAMPLFYDKARDVIRRPNQSGFRDVFKVGEKWQAKVYVGPKDQRHAGYFGTPEAAADEVLRYLCTGVPPPKPERERRKRGEGPQPPAKRPKARQQATPLAELPAQPIMPATLAELGVYTAPCFDGEAPGAPTVVASALDTM